MFVAARLGVPRGPPFASCHVYLCCCMPGRALGHPVCQLSGIYTCCRMPGTASGDPLLPTVGYKNVAARLGEPQGTPFNQALSICMLLHACAYLGGLPFATCQIYVCGCCVPASRGTSLLLAGEYMYVAVCLGGPRRTPFCQLSVYVCAAACLGGPRRTPWS